MFQPKVLTVRKAALAGLVSLLIISPPGAFSAQDEPPPFPFEQYKLKNGLRVVLSEDENLPLVAIVVAYGVGSLQDPPRQSGIAYLLENLMFQGSENIGSMQHIPYIQKTGGILSATTMFDKTVFYQTVPSNQLALVLWLESDRMRSLDITAAKVEEVKENLLAEHRQRRASEPYLESLLLFDRILFGDAVFGRPFIGAEEEIRAIREEDVRNFHATYYSPGNAVLCIAGNFAPSKAKELVARYFETIPAGPAEIPPLPSPHADEKKESFETFRDSLASAPGFHLGWRFPALQPGDRQALMILDCLLLRGRSARLYRRLIRKDRTALYLNGGLEERGPLLALKIFAINNNEVMVDRCQRALLSEVDKLKTGFVSAEELSKAKNIVKMEFMNRFSTMLERAIFLAGYALSRNGQDNPAEELDRILRITPAFLIGTASRQLTAKNLFILSIQKK